MRVVVLWGWVSEEAWACVGVELPVLLLLLLVLAKRARCSSRRCWRRRMTCFVETTLLCTPSTNLARSRAPRSSRHTGVQSGLLGGGEKEKEKQQSM